jgi:UDP-N-acetylmuramoylalanine--D-glutamate ligase
VELSGKRVVVVGLGRSGVAAARLCRARGAEVIATDSAPLDRLSAEARGLEASVIAGGHGGVPFEKVDLVVVSPGVPAMPAFDDAERVGVEVIGELELASRFVTAPIIAVGGTNGKSTTTVMASTILADSFGRVFCGGNLGVPLSEAVLSGTSWDRLVVEVSSFQLERAPTFKPAVSVLLNVSEDHLDRYPNALAYAQAKGNAFVNQTPRDTAVVPAADQRCLAQAWRGKGKVVTFGSDDADYRVQDLQVEERNSKTRFSLVGTEIHGEHNALNAAAAIAAARGVGAGQSTIQRGLVNFRALPHRMTLVGEIDEVRFFDDSKATNVGAAVTALRGLREPRAVLVAGGRDKLGSYDALVASLEERGRGVVLIGEAAERIARAVGERVPVVRAKSMDEAVGMAFRLAERGDAVLLSPACSSFDMFASYSERGDAFVRAVERLMAEQQEVTR